MKKNIVYFDLETQKSANEVGGWHNKREMRMSIGVTYSTYNESYKIYDEKEVEDLVQELQRADCVVGFNTINFDYEVLSPYSVFDLCQIPSLDLLVGVEKGAGRRIGLDALASTTLGVGKTAHGMEALKWWKQGKIKEIAEYCCYDVKTTKLLHEYGAYYGKIFYQNKISKKKETIAVDWKV